MGSARSLALLEMVISVVLVGAAALWNHWRTLGLWGQFQWRAEAAALGFLLALALFIVLSLLQLPAVSRLPLVRDLKEIWDLLCQTIAPELTVRQIVLLAACSGFSEEVFFRGVLQREIGLLWASTIFGLLHFVNLAYALWAGIVGVLLGLALQKGSTLLAPVIAHGTYNLLALLLLRRHARTDRRGPA